MDVGCPKCQTEYELDDTRVPEDGVTVKCTTCGHIFRVKRKSLIVTLPVRPDDARARGATAPDELPPAPPSREWKLRQPSGRLLVCRELTTLQKWIIENKVGRDDEISLTGDTWKRLGEIPELASFFQIVDEAAKARTFEAIHGPTPVPMSPMSPLPPAMPPASSRPSGLRPAPKITETWKEPNFSQKFPDIVTEPALSPVPPPPPPPSEPPLPPRTQQRKEELTRRYEPSESQLQKAVGNQPSGSGKWVALVLLLAAGGAAGYYFGVYEPQQHQQVTQLPTPVATTPSPEPVVTIDAGVAVVDAGAPDAGQPDAGEPDAGPVDAGATAAPVIEAPVDAGRPVVAVPPEQPKRSFENILAQADSLRERERVEAAMNLYGMAHEMRPDRVEPLAGRGLSLLDLGNAAAAEAAFDQALKLNGRYAPAIMGMAESLRTQGKNARAIEFYQRYLDVLPEGSEASVARNNIERLKK